MSIESGEKTHKTLVILATVTSIAASITAVASLFVSVWSGIETRRHDRLSVKPILEITKDLSEDANDYGLILSNKGVGPSCEMKWELFVMDKLGEEQNVGKSLEGFKKARDILGINCNFGYYETLQPGDNQPIFWFRKAEWNKLSKKNQKDIAEKMDKIKLKIVYESIYGETYYLKYP
jgi:hypothetical protein